MECPRLRPRYESCLLTDPEVSDRIEGIGINQALLLVSIVAIDDR